MLSRNDQGFTLIELMLVVVLMGFTTMLGLSSYYRFMNDARLNSGGKALAGLIKFGAWPSKIPKPAPCKSIPLVAHCS